MTTTLKAIPTPYGGVKFRSRLEARWAMFFDQLHIPWEYEPQGFDIGDDQAYLPDFLLGLGDIVWAEVKPSVWADKDGVIRWRKFLSAQPALTAGYLLTSMTSDPLQAFMKVWSDGQGGLIEALLSWSSCPAAYHFELRARGDLAECRQCGGTVKCSSCDGTGLHHAGRDDEAPCYCCDPPGSGRAYPRTVPWDGDERISEAYSAALSARFGTG